MERAEKIFELLKELSSAENITAESELQKDILLDSLGMVTLLILLEEKFNIELDESDMDPFALVTVSDVIALVGRYVGDE